MSTAPHPGDRLIVSLLQPLARGEYFRKWPLHLTILPWFRSKLGTRELQAIITESLQGIEPFSAEMGETTQFGFKDQVPVRVVQTPNHFEEVHRRLLQTFRDHPEIYILDTSHTGDHFRAHVTLHGYEPLREGDIIACNDLQIVRLGTIHPGGSTKEVEGEIDLGQA